MFLKCTKTKSKNICIFAAPFPPPKRLIVNGYNSKLSHPHSTLKGMKKCKSTTDSSFRVISFKQNIKFARKCFLIKTRTKFPKTSLNPKKITFETPVKYKWLKISEFQKPQNSRLSNTSSFTRRPTIDAKRKRHKTSSKNAKHHVRDSLIMHILKQNRSYGFGKKWVKRLQKSFPTKTF